jgi:serine-type D-Ala-D-Ala carboxypeptidase (penicillin-binding protein 5/6)
MTDRGRRAGAVLGALAAVLLTGLAGLPAPAAFAAAAAGRARTADGGTAAGGGTGAARADVGGTQLARTGMVVHYPARGGRRLPRIPARAWVIADADTGQVLAAKDAHGVFPPASTLKVLTAITLIPRLSPDMLVKTTRRATSVVPNVVGLIRGRRYRVSDLFRALLLISANDAAVALAQATGSYRRGMALINAEAHHLQAYDVVAKDPNGLPAGGQHVSAYDLALIGRQALKVPAFLKYDETLAARFPVRPGHKVTLVNQNTLLTSYRGGIGGKIGWTEEAHATYLGLARRHGVTLIVALLHCTPLQEITSGEKLLTWGFAMDGKVAPVGTLVPPLTAAAAGPAAGASRPGAGGTGRLAGGSGTAGANAAGRRGAGQAAAARPATAGLPAIAVAVAVLLIAAVLAGTGWAMRLSRRHRPA